MSEVRIVDLEKLGVSIDTFNKIYSMGEEDGRADAIDEYKKKIEFLEEWLFVDCKLSNPDVAIVFDTLKRYAEHLKKENNNG